MYANIIEAIRDSFLERIFIGVWNLIRKNGREIGIAGFFILVIGSLLNFVPVVERTWRSGPTGLVVAVSCLAGCFLLHKKQYFTCFFIAMFSAFFLVHEVIIVYDNYVVEQGKELGPDGLFRPVFLIFADAFTPGQGAFWSLFGSILALIGIFGSWADDILNKNNEAECAAQSDVSRPDDEEDYSAFLSDEEDEDYEENDEDIWDSPEESDNDDE